MNQAPDPWEQRYQSGDMPWEKGEPCPGLVDFLAAHPELAQGHPTVAVPGCGTGHDVRAWAQAGFHVSGFDLAPSAVRLAQERSRAAGLTIPFLQADFLQDPPPGPPFDWMFEHTLFCAIQPERRPDYLNSALRWLKSGGHLLAVHYMIRDTEGPPFGTHQQELFELFSPHFDLRQGWIPRSYPNRTGLELMFWWKRRC